MDNLQIPVDVNNVADSVELFDVCEKIGQDLGLHIDQIGQLDAQIRAILRGHAKSENFLKDIRDNLEINEELARTIITRVNKDVFQMVRELMQKNTDSTPSAQPASPPSLAEIEKAGGFTVEKPKEDPPPAQTAEPVPTEAPDLHPPVENRATILEGIENPTSGTEKISRKETSSAYVAPATPRTEPLVDRLLQNTVTQTKTAALTPAPTPPPIPTSTPVVAPTPKLAPIPIASVTQTTENSEPEVPHINFVSIKIPPTPVSPAPKPPAPAAPITPPAPPVPPTPTTAPVNPTPPPANSTPPQTPPVPPPPPRPRGTDPYKEPIN